MGPYETEDAAAAEPMPRKVAEMHHNSADPRAVRDLQLSFLREACTDAGVEWGAYERRIATWLAGYAPEHVQVLIGWVSRAHAAGIEHGRRACRG